MTLRLDFYNAAAQLIPLLVVAAAVDTRVWANEDKRRPSEITSELITFVMVTLAWVVSLYVVATGKHHPLAGCSSPLGSQLGGPKLLARSPCIVAVGSDMPDRLAASGCG